MFEQFKEYYGAHCADKTKPYDGIMELLDALKEQGIKLAVVSNKADYAVKALCEQYFCGYFDEAVYEDDGETLDYQKGAYNEYQFVRKGNSLTMKMDHEGYASTYKKLVVRYGERARGLVFNKEMEITL